MSFSFDGETEYSVECAEDLFSDGMTFDDAVAAVKELVRGRTLVCYDFKSRSPNATIWSRSGFFDIIDPRRI